MSEFRMKARSGWWIKGSQSLANKCDALIKEISRLNELGCNIEIDDSEISGGVLVWSKTKNKIPPACAWVRLEDAINKYLSTL